MEKIEIEWLSDSHDCETCGTSWAEGARVLFPDGHVLELEPVAHCFGGKHHDEREVYKAILDHLGYTVVEVSGETDETALETVEG